MENDIFLIVIISFALMLPTAIEMLILQFKEPPK